MTAPSEYVPSTDEVRRVMAVIDSIENSTGPDLYPGERERIARAILSSPWLAEHDAGVEERERMRLRGLARTTPYSVADLIEMASAEASLAQYVKSRPTS